MTKQGSSGPAACSWDNETLRKMQVSVHVEYRSRRVMPGGFVKLLQASSLQALGVETQMRKLRPARRWRPGPPRPPFPWKVATDTVERAGEGEAGLELFVVVSSRLETPPGGLGRGPTGAEGPGHRTAPWWPTGTQTHRLTVLQGGGLAGLPGPQARCGWAASPRPPAWPSSAPPRPPRSRPAAHTCLSGLRCLLLPSRPPAPLLLYPDAPGCV